MKPTKDELIDDLFESVDKLQKHEPKLYEAWQIDPEDDDFDEMALRGAASFLTDNSKYLQFWCISSSISVQKKVNVPVTPSEGFEVDPECPTNFVDFDVLKDSFLN